MVAIEGGVGALHAGPEGRERQAAADAPAWQAATAMVRITAVIAVVATVLVVAITASVRSAQRAEQGPQLTAAELTADPDNVLRGALRVTTDTASTVAVELRSPDHAFRVVPSGPAATEHAVPLLQLRPEHRYRVSVQLGDGGAPRGEREQVGEFVTGALPDDMPPIDVTSQPDAMSPGLTLFDSQYRAPEGEEGYDDEGWLQAVDAEGEVVWYHREPLNIQDARRLDDGDLLYISDETGARRLTPSGEVVGEWRGTSPKSAETDIGAGLGPGQVVDVDVHSMHHEVLELPNGNYLTLSREIREVAYPEGVCEEFDDDAPPFDGTYDVVGDAIIEFDPDTGEVVKDYSLFDVLDPLDDDPLLAEADFCIDYLDQHYPDRQPRDWTHANAVVPDFENNALIVSNRHTDQILALRYADDEEGAGGELLWAFGPYEDMELRGADDWFFHQHAPQVQDDGTILLYDNGTDRPGTPSDEQYSRPVRYRVDPEAGVVEQVWEHRLDPPLYASFLGDADRLDGTVLSTHGGDSIALEDGDGSALMGTLVEVDEETGETVFRLRTADPEGGAGWAIYRAERIPTIYPAGYEVVPLWTTGSG